jgi:hypothetical protein
MLSRVAVFLAHASAALATPASTTEWAYPDTPPVFDNPSFVVSVLSGNIPARTLSAESAGEVTRQVMAAAHGDKYVCFIPVKVGAAAEAEKHALSRREKLSAIVNHADRNCVLRMIAFWTYEVCPGRHVRQMRVAQQSSGSSSPTIEFSLGSYEAGQDTIHAEVQTSLSTH